MKKITYIYLLIFLSLGVMPVDRAMALDLVYLKAVLGLPVTTDGSIDGTDIETDIDPPYPMTLGVGAYISPLFSVALEINYETAELSELPSTITDDESKQFGALLNLYFHLPQIIGLEPFVGGGVGYTFVNFEDNDVSGDGFIWHLSAGLDWNINNFIALTAEARFLEPVEISLEDDDHVDVGDFDYTQTKLLVGVKIKL